MLTTTGNKRVRVQLIEPHPGQQRVLAGLKRFTVLRMGRRFGKTDLGIDYLVRRAPRGIFAGYPVGWFAATNKVLDDAWREAKEALIEFTVAKNEVLHRLRFVNRSSLEFWSLESDVVARSRKYGAIVIDEAAHAPNLEDQWAKSIRPTLLDYRGWCLFASTPSGKNFFHELDQRSLTRPG